MFVPVPMSNVPPALPTVLVALADLEEDGALLCIALGAAPVMLVVCVTLAWQTADAAVRLAGQPSPCGRLPRPLRPFPWGDKRAPRPVSPNASRRHRSAAGTSVPPRLRICGECGVRAWFGSRGSTASPTSAAVREDAPKALQRVRSKSPARRARGARRLRSAALVSGRRWSRHRTSCSFRFAQP